MIFLNPLVLFGLFASAIPLIIHLLNLRKLKKIEFSSIAFLKELQQNKIRKLKFKQWLLLILRTLIIIFLVLVFARPTLQSIDLGGAAPAAKSSSVFILDNSYSMTSIEQSGSYINQSKKIIREIISNSNEGDDFAVIGSASGTNVPVLRTSRDLFLKELDNLKLAYKSGNYLSALKNSENLLNGSHNLNKNILLFTDLQKNNITMQEGNDTLSREKTGNLLFLFKFGTSKPGNLAIKELNLENQIFEKEKPVSITAAVSNTGNTDFNNSIISLFANGIRIAQKSFNLSKGSEKKIEFETVLNQTGYINLFAEIEDDDYLQDNRQYASVYIPKTINVCLLYKNEDDLNFVKPALSNEIVEKTVNLSSINIVKNRSYDLNPFDVVFFIGSGDVTLTNRLKLYLSEGGRLVLMPSSGETPDNYSAFLLSLDIAASVRPLGKKGVFDQPSEFSTFDKNHLIFRDMFATGNQLPGSPEFYYYFEYNFTGKNRTIISLLNDIPFLSEIDNDNSKILLFNTAPSLLWSDWPLKAIFAPLTAKSVFYLSSKTKAQQNHMISDPAPVNIINVNTPLLRIIRPDASEDFINIDSLRKGSFINYERTDLPGVYTVYSNDEIINTFTVNVNTTESESVYLNEEDIQDFLDKINFSGKLIPVNDRENYETELYQARFGTELWKIFLLLALFLALIEMYISRSSKKDLVHLGK